MTLSIVIPLYNKAQSIEATIRCLQAQTYDKFEVVVVEGWSTDGSQDIIRRLASEDTRIHVFIQENRHGVTPARNETIEHSANEHIVFMDADDYWEPTYLESMVRLINDYPHAGIWGIGYGTMIDDKQIANQKWQEKPYKQFRGLLPANPWKEWGCPYWTSATAISKTAFKEIGGFDNSIIFGEDIDLWWRLMLRYPAAFDATQTLSFYRTDAENRACNNVFPLEKHIPFYIDKYAAYRAESKDFRQFFDRQILYRLYPYCFDKRYKKEINRILGEVDFSLQKKSMYWRFRLPRIYRWWTDNKN